MTTNLKQIAKQVSLLNRLIELLRMQEDFDPYHLEEFNWEPCGIRDTCHWNYFDSNQDCFTIFGVQNKEAWNHPITQKAWSDELVRVAGELDLPKKELKSFIGAAIFDIAMQFDYIRAATAEYQINLDIILNKYGRSLSE